MGAWVRILGSAALLALAGGVAGCGGDEISRTLGAACDSHADCDDRCLPPTDDYPGGFCSVDCASERDCPSNATCVDKEGGVCLFECSGAEDCAFLGAGWSCKLVDALPDGTRLVCIGD